MMYKDVWLSPPMVEDISKKTRSHKRTVERWLQRRKIPETPLRLLQIIQSGHLHLIHDSWDGWRICSRTGQLWTPAGDKIHPADLLAMKYRMHQIRALRTELKESKRLLDKRTEHPDVTVRVRSDSHVRH